MDREKLARERTQALEIANQVLAFVKQRNLDGLKGLFNEANRSVFEAGGRGSKKFRRGFERQLEFASKKYERVSAVSEVREMYCQEEMNLQAVVAKIRQEKHLMFVVTLTREGDRFLFDHLGAPHVLEYQKWKPFGPPGANDLPDEPSGKSVLAEMDQVETVIWS